MYTFFLFRMNCECLKMTFLLVEILNSDKSIEILFGLFEIDTLTTCQSFVTTFRPINYRVKFFEKNRIN